MAGEWGRMPALSRRAMLAGSGALVVAGQASGALPPLAPFTSDEEYWRGVAQQYRVTNEVIQLENGNWGMMPALVHAEYLEHVARLNRDTSFYARRGLGRDIGLVQERLAEALGVQRGEIAFTRNATEALKALIDGYNRLEPGDAVLYADLDYDTMQRCMDTLAHRARAEVIRIALPEPASKASLLEAYREAFSRNPNIRLVLLTHLSHRTGLVVPVREIAALARERGIDTVVDAAHSWCQLDFDLADLDCDFVGLNGHKWLGAPLGVGVLYVRGGAAAKLNRDAGNGPGLARDASDCVHMGTANAAPFLSIPPALEFHEAIGSASRTARLRALRDRWVGQVRHLERVEVLTPDDPDLYGAITSFRIAGRTTAAENNAIAAALLDDHRIFTVQRSGPHRGACVRVTPSLFNSLAEMDRLAAAIHSIAKL